LSTFRTVSIRVSDSRDMKPTPNRFRISTSSGDFFAPLGRCATFPIGKNECVSGGVRIAKENWFYSDGSCEIELQVETNLRVQISKGPGFSIIDKTIQLSHGQLALRFNLDRVFEPIEPWQSGDCRVHFTSPEETVLQAAAENCQYTELLSRVVDYASLDGNGYATIPQHTSFSGTEISRSRFGSEVAVNSWNFHPVLGSLSLLNTHRPVYPIAFGGTQGNDDWTIPAWCDQARRKSGLAIWSEFDKSFAADGFSESLVAALLGKIDAVEMSSTVRQNSFFPNYYALLNLGLKLPLVGCSGKDSNQTILGSIRTWAISKDGTHASWLEGIRAGQTTVSSGPYLSIKLGDKEIGDTAECDDRKEFPIHLQVNLVPAGSIVQIIQNGKSIYSKSFSNDATSEQWEVPIRFKSSGWIAARIFSTQRSSLYPSELLFAHTSPIWIEVPEAACPIDTAAMKHFEESLDRLESWLLNFGQFSSDKTKQDHLTHLQKARLRLQPN
jgi:hypothetical protein